jgi:peptidoglycan endopeptidase LytE
VPTEEPRKVITYQVVAGDTLAGLAQRFGVSAETIVWANDLPDGGGVLRVGQELTIPPVSGVLYRVRKGDTLLAIALRHEVSPQEIIDANVLERPDLLSIDQQLIIPGARRVPPPASMPQTGSLQHRVARGETVTTIAQRYGVDAGAIVSANGLADPDMIRAGQLLLIPGVAAPPAAHEGAQPSPPPSDKGQEIAAIAAQFVGYRYVYGGTTPATGFDCSGFSMYVYGQAGISISRGLAGQLAAGRTVGRGELLPGDLVFFQNTFRAGLSHVGIYVGGGRFVHAASPPNGVRFDTLDMAYYDVRYYGASRPWE